MSVRTGQRAYFCHFTNALKTIHRIVKSSILVFYGIENVSYFIWYLQCHFSNIIHIEQYYYLCPLYLSFYKILTKFTILSYVLTEATSRNILSFLIAAYFIHLFIKTFCLLDAALKQHNMRNIEVLLRDKLTFVASNKLFTCTSVCFLLLKNTRSLQLQHLLYIEIKTALKQ